MPLKTWHYAAPFTSDSHIPSFCWPYWLSSGRATATIDIEEDMFPTRSFRLVVDHYGFSMNIVCDSCEMEEKPPDVYDWCKAAQHNKRCLPIAVFLYVYIIISGESNRPPVKKTGWDFYWAVLQQIFAINSVVHSQLLIFWSCIVRSYDNSLLCKL